jgi:hypothetical protein
MRCRIARAVAVRVLLSAAARTRIIGARSAGTQRVFASHKSTLDKHPRRLRRYCRARLVTGGYAGLVKKALDPIEGAGVRNEASHIRDKPRRPGDIQTPVA